MGSHLTGLPGIILAVIAALGAFQAYVHKREELAVARVEWKQERSKLQNKIVTDALAADTRDRVRTDSIAQLNTTIQARVTTAAAAGSQYAAASATLAQLVVNNPVAKAALDSMNVAHRNQVLSLEQALAASKAATQQEQARVADRDAQLVTLRADYATAITKADGFEKQAHPGAIKRVLDSPVTHLLAFGVGYAAGSR